MASFLLHLSAQNPLQYTLVIKAEPAQSNKAEGVITRYGQTYMLNDQTAMRGDAYGVFLSQRCTAAYQQYMSGRRTATAGWVLFGAGLGLATAGVGMTTGIFGDCYTEGFLFMYGAAACETAAIPMLIVGYCKQHRSADTYNLAASRPQAYWTVGTTRNGLTLSYNF